MNPNIITQYLFKVLFITDSDPETYSTAVPCVSPLFMLITRIPSALGMAGLLGYALTSPDVSTSSLVFILFLTLNGCMMTWVYFMLVIIDAMINRGKERCRSLKYVAEFIFQLAFSIQIVVTFFFWYYLFNDYIVRESNKFVGVGLGLFHSAPMFTLLFDFCLNNARFQLRRLLLILPFGVLYLVLNWQVSTAVDQPVYNFLTWQDSQTTINIAAIGISAIGTYIFGKTIYICVKKPKKSLQNGPQQIQDESAKNKMKSILRVEHQLRV